MVSITRWFVIAFGIFAIVLHIVLTLEDLQPDIIYKVVVFYIMTVVSAGLGFIFGYQWNGLD